MPSASCATASAPGRTSTEEHGEDALTFEDCIERIAYGGVTWVNDDGELETGVTDDP